ncbi:MAG: TonB family protein [Xanthomonadales bacterium]|nr:TonB family protein [Xanthomonadales bacterium]
MTKIFISYRRKDNPFAARSVYEALCVKFGKENVFYDVERMRAGRDFREQIDKMLSWCDVMLVVIGDKWLQSDESGRPRLENPEDSLRIEVSTALSRDIKVIPVLIGDAPSLTKIEPSLPEDVKPLIYRHYIVVKPGEDFNAHIDKLIKQISIETKDEDSADENPPVPVPAKTLPWKWLIGVFLVITIPASVYWYWFSLQSQQDYASITEIASVDSAPDSVKRVIEQLKEYSSFSSTVATTEGAIEILDSLGLQDISWKEGEYATAPIDSQFKVTIWVQSYDKPNVFGVRYGTNETSWNWEATYFEIVIPHDMVDPSLTDCQPNLTLNLPERTGLMVKINGVVLPSSGCPEIVRMRWTWGDGAVANSGFPASHQYSDSGKYEISVTAYDAEENSSTQSVRITIAQPEPVEEAKGETPPPSPLQNDDDPTDSTALRADPLSIRREEYNKYYLPIETVTPVYPSNALSRGIEGTCQVELTVTELGTVRNPTVVQGKCTSSLFHRSSINAALKLKYRTQLVKGKPVERVGLKYTFKYEISD